MRLTKYKEHNQWQLQVTFRKRVVLNMYWLLRKLHRDLQFTKLSQNFASVYTASGQGVGLCFHSNTMHILEILFSEASDSWLIQNSRGCSSTCKRHNTTVLYGISVAKSVQ